MNGMKMSKSMKNFIPIETFLNEHSSDDFRMICLTTHYRTSIDYKPDVLKKSKVLVKKFRAFLEDAKNYCRGSWQLGHVSAPVLLEVKSKEISFLNYDLVFSCWKQVRGKLTTTWLTILTQLSA